MSFNESEARKETNQEVATPRLRVNKTTSMTLTTSYQDVILNGTSPFNLNSFTTIPGESNPSVWYDPATGLFRFTANTDHNYSLGISTSMSAASF